MDCMRSEMIRMTLCKYQGGQNTSYYTVQVVHCVQRLCSLKMTKYTHRVVVCLSAVCRWPDSVWRLRECLVVRKVGNDNGINWETTRNWTIYLWKRPNNTKQPPQPLNPPSHYYRFPPPSWRRPRRLRKCETGKELSRIEGEWKWNKLRNEWTKCVM